MTCRLRWCVEIETKCRIPIWRTFGRIQWHVIPEPRITLQGAATWWIHFHDSRATCHIAGCSHLTKWMSWLCHIAGCKISIRHIENRFSPYFIFLFLMQFSLWRAAAFVSSPMHLLPSCSFESTSSLTWSACTLLYRELKWFFQIMQTSVSPVASPTFVAYLVALPCVSRQMPLQICI